MAELLVISSANKPNVRIRFFISSGWSIHSNDKVSTYLRPLNAEIPQRLHLNFRKSLIHYHLEGSGCPVILLHGFLEDSRMWESLSSDLVDHCNVITIDLPGHGKSDCLGYSHSMEDMAETVRKVVNEEKIIDPVIIGHSMGGYVALAYAENYGSELAGLGLFHSTGFPDSDQKKIDRQRAIEAAMKRPDLYPEMTIPNLFNQERTVELKSKIDECVEIARSQPVQGVVANLRGMMERQARTTVFRDLKCQKVFVHGVKDPVLNLDLAKEQCRGVRSLTKEFLDDVGHMGHLEAPSVVSSIFQKFIKECQADG